MIKRCPEITLRQALVLTGCLEQDGEKISGKYKDLVYLRKENEYGSEMYGISEAMKKFDPDQASSSLCSRGLS